MHTQFSTPIHWLRLRKVICVANFQCQASRGTECVCIVLCYCVCVAHVWVEEPPGIGLVLVLSSQSKLKTYLRGRMLYPGARARMCVCAAPTLLIGCQLVAKCLAEKKSIKSIDLVSENYLLGVNLVG